MPSRAGHLLPGANVACGCRCAPCRQFTPELIKTYERINKDGKNFEVVFVSLDKSMAQFQVGSTLVPVEV